MVIQTGINDFFKYRNKCPSYWKGTEEELVWKRGYNKAKKACL